MQPVTKWLTLAIATLTVLVVGWLWGFGGLALVQSWAAEGQRDVQDSMADALQGLRSGAPGALVGLWLVCFLYGFFHAAGPGHGKLLIGGYGVGAPVALRRLVMLAVLSSLAQAATAVLMVYGGLYALGLGREAVTDFSDEVLAAVSYAAIGLIGVWLVLRGLRRWLKGAGHVISEDGTCSHCGHKHGPDLEEAAQVNSLREAVALIGAVAIRPCTGALFLLILAWRFSVDFAGISGAFVMGLGTASVTVAVAVAAVSLREGFVTRLNSTARALPLVEMVAGAIVAVASLQVVLTLLPAVN